MKRAIIIRIYTVLLTSLYLVNGVHSSSEANVASKPEEPNNTCIAEEHGQRATKKNGELKMTATAKFLVVGRTRIGKGTFISTAHSLLRGSELPGIVSDGIKSHTKQTRGYKMHLGERDIEMIDTVGVDDSSVTNIAEETFLRLLQDIGKAAFYPPLVIIQTISATEQDFLKKVESVFQQVVVAIRAPSSEVLKYASQDLSEIGVDPLAVFHIQTYMNPSIDQGASHSVYVDGVRAILDFYSSLTPTRESLNFTSKLFAGKLERMLSEKEVKEEMVHLQSIESKEEDIKTTVAKKISLVNGGHTEVYGREELPINSVLNSAMAPAMKMLFLPPALVFSALVGLKNILVERRKWVEDYKEEIVYEDAIETIRVNYEVKTLLRNTYQREVYDVFKILAGEIKIFKHQEIGEWKLLKSEELDRKIIKA